MTTPDAGWGSGVDILADVPPEAPGRRVPWWAVAAVVAVVSALIGGIAYGVGRLSGGGAQPEDALASGVVAFAKVDLDPPVGQKLDAIRFLRRFPTLRERLSEDADLRKVLFDAVAADAGWKDVDFGRDVAPWLGQRVGVGAYPSSMLPGLAGRAALQRVVVALQVSDEGAARAGLDRLIALAPAGVKPAYVVNNGYALLAEDRSVAAAVGERAASDGTLAGQEHFADDLAALGDGVAAVWMDGSGLEDLVPVAGVLGMGLGGPDGLGDLGALGALDRKTTRVAYALRFDGPDVLELAGHVSGAPTLAGGPAGDATVTGLDDLPASTAAAAGLGGGKDLVQPLLTALESRGGDASGKGGDAAGKGGDAAGLVAEAERATGLDLPDDLEVLLGSNLLVALDRTGLGDGGVQVGARVVTSDPARADQILARLNRRLAGGEPKVVHHATADGYVVASSEEQAARLAAGAAGATGATGATGDGTGGRLGEQDTFRRALPDLEGARFAAWIDLRMLIAAFTGAGGEGDGPGGDLAPLDGLGLTATSDGEGNGDFRARLVVR